MHALNVNRLLNHCSALIGPHFWGATTNHSETHILGGILIGQKLQGRTCRWSGFVIINQRKSILRADIIHNQFLIGGGTVTLWPIS